VASLRQLRSDGPSRNGFDDLQTWIQMANASSPCRPPLSSAARRRPARRRGLRVDLQVERDRVRLHGDPRSGLLADHLPLRLDEQRQGRQAVRRPRDRHPDKPWPNGTSGDLASRMILDADSKGAFFGVREGDRIYRRDPEDVDRPVRQPGRGRVRRHHGLRLPAQGQAGPRVHLPARRDVPLDAGARPRRVRTKGMSWITPILREIRSDNAATDHKAQFFANGGHAEHGREVPRERDEPGPVRPVQGEDGGRVRRHPQRRQDAVPGARRGRRGRRARTSRSSTSGRPRAATRPASRPPPACPR
jgi:hypothetical protein